MYLGADFWLIWDGILVAAPKDQDRSKAGFVTWSRYQDRSTTGFVMLEGSVSWIKYEGRGRSSKRNRRRQ